MKKEISPETRQLLLRYQQLEETDHLIYSRMAAREKDERNRQILSRIALDEKQHALVWSGYTGQTVSASRLKACWYSFLSLVFGYTFILKVMEKNEYVADDRYRLLMEELPEAHMIALDEQSHEHQLMEMLDEERLKYVGSMVLGLNDALVELSGTLAGLTLALADGRLVALAGIITGVAATLSMAASNYLAQRAEGNKDALKSSFYTGGAYLLTVICLVAPYLVLPRDMYLTALMVMLGVVILIIFFFNYYIAVAKSLPFLRRFGEMAAISLGVAVISFIIGLLAKYFLGLEV